MSTLTSAQPTAAKRRTIVELLQLSDFGRLNPERARELARGSSRNEPVKRPVERDRGQRDSAVR